MNGEARDPYKQENPMLYTIWLEFLYSLLEWAKRNKDTRRAYWARVFLTMVSPSLGAEAL